MGKVAFVFPGQGSQKVGMGQAIHEADEAARAVFTAADEALGESLSALPLVRALLARRAPLRRAPRHTVQSAPKWDAAPRQPSERRSTGC